MKWGDGKRVLKFKKLVAKRLPLPPLPREIAMFQHSDFAGRGMG